MVLYRLAVKLYLQESEWEHYNISDKVYVNDILLIENNVEFSGKHKGVFERSFSKKDFGEDAYILNIKIYRDRSRRFIGLSQRTYLHKVLKKFKMDQAKKRVLACVTRCEVDSDSMPDHYKR